MGNLPIILLVSALRLKYVSATKKKNFVEVNKLNTAVRLLITHIHHFHIVK